MTEELESLIEARNLLNSAERRISFVISELIPKCKYYYYDSDACEESCTCQQIDWHLKEFEPEKNCIGCKFREVKK